MNKHERRSTEVEFRSAGRIISGYAAKWNTLSEDLGGFIETLSPYCFDLANSPSIFLTYEHETGEILDRSDGGTLQLRQDEVGLHFEATLPQRSPKIDVEGLIEQVQRKILRGCSFSFDTVDEGEQRGATWTRLADGRRLRTINKAVLFDVCVTPCPAYPDTEVAVRSLRTLASHENLSASRQRLNHLTRSHTLQRLVSALHR